jgi:hemerythrin-like domain-containing protein
MIEHRLIERMIALMGSHLERLRAEGVADPDFIVSAVEFIRTYADRCHHGKEEDILFRDLSSKPLETPLKQMMHDLIQEHVYSRQQTGKLALAGERYRDGDSEALGQIEQQLALLVDFYPRHIEKEDRHFFVPSLDCFSKKEQADMLARFHEFDRQLIHEHYRDVVKTWETGQ